MANQNQVSVTLADSTVINCVIEKHTYNKNRNLIAIQLYAADTDHNRQHGVVPGMPMGTPTVCFPEFTFQENETAMKDCDEYDGFLNSLEQAGVVRCTGHFVRTSDYSYPIVEVLI